jgi:hypothetical protein
MNFILIRFVNDLYLAIMKKKSLAETHPEVAKQWHPTLNGDLLPNDVTFGTSKKIWWLCSNGHNFNASVNRRTSMMTNCPNCQGRKAGDDNNLSVVFPEIAKEWHPNKNGKLTPFDFSQGSTNKKIWWKCDKGHEWQERILNRTKKLNPKCKICK